MRRSELLFDSGNRPTERFAMFLHDVQIPGGDLVSIDSALQNRFFQKDAAGAPRERWQLQEVEVACPRPRLLRHLRLCGFVDATIPQQWNYKRAGWPGALLPRATVRLQDLIDAWTAGVRWTENIVFGGKRPLQATETSVVGYLASELDMMHSVWDFTKMPDDLRALPVTFVDAPMKPPLKEGGPEVRPNTEDTIVHWLRSDPEPGSMLVSSGAPYGMAQDEAFAMLLAPRGHTVETFGHSCPTDLPIENLMREVAGCVNRIRRARGI